MDQRASEATNFYPSAGQMYILGGLGGRDKKKVLASWRVPKGDGDQPTFMDDRMPLERHDFSRTFRVSD